MTALLSFRDGVKDFCSKYDKFVSPLCKFILAIVMFWSIAHLTGYNSMMSSMVVVLAASFVCAFLSDSLIFETRCMLSSRAIVLICPTSVSSVFLRANIEF